jgi:hypothetical protein
MSNALLMAQPIDYSELEKLYPGFRKISSKFNPEHLALLEKLALLNKYNVPLNFYAQELSLFEENIKKVCEGLAERSEDRSFELVFPNEMPASTSDGSPPEPTEPRPPPSKYSVAEIRRFIKAFNTIEDAQLVSSDIISTI